MQLLIILYRLTCADKGPLLLTWFNFNPSMDNSSYMPDKVWDEITWYSFLNFNGATVEV